MPEPVKRVHYFDHQFLRADDFNDEQKYHIDMRRMHNKLLHTWGIAGGLDVISTHEHTEIIVTEGVAIDSQGREIVLNNYHQLELSRFPEGTDVYVTAAYSENTTDSTDETGTSGDTRWTEEPLIDTSGTPPGGGGEVILLARVVRSGNTFEIDHSGRRSASAVSSQPSGPTTPGDQSIINRMIADNAIDASKIRSGSVGTPQLADGAVTVDKIAADALTQHSHTAQEIGAIPASGGMVSGTLAAENESLGIRVYLSAELRRNAGWSGLYVDAEDRYDSYGIIVNGDNLQNTIDGETVFTGNVTVRGNLTAGSKSGYVVDRFINGSGKTIQNGDVVKLLGAPIGRYTGRDNKIPIPWITLADKEGDSAVIGVVDCAANADHDPPDRQTSPENLPYIPDEGEVNVVTVGNYAHCKVDATDDPVEVGDLLTTSYRAGYAKKAAVPKIGSIIGKALEPLAEGTGCIAVFVNIQ